MEKLSKYLQKIDIFGSRIDLMLDGRKVHKTSFGVGK